MSYISPMPESRDSSIKGKRFSSTNKMPTKENFPNIKNKIKPKGFQSYLSSMAGLPTSLNKIANTRKPRIATNKSQGDSFTNTGSVKGKTQIAQPIKEIMKVPLSKPEIEISTKTVVGNTIPKTFNKTRTTTNNNASMSVNETNITLL